MTLSFMQAIISLVKSAIDGSHAEITADTDWRQVFNYSKNQTLVPLVYYGILESDIDIPDEIKQSFNHCLLSHILVDQRQQFELAKIYEAFDRESIEYMPIKGAVLRPIYPKTEMRPMGDADILIRMHDKDKVEDNMVKLGYTLEKESAHEYVFNKDNICIEIHKCLIPPYSKDYYAYYGDGWQLANKAEDGSRYEMSKEDHFTYLITHFAKHYRAGGIGVLHMVDFWVYLRTYQIDTDYVRGELEKLSLGKFFDNVMQTVDSWFNGAPYTEMTQFITQHIFNNGIWGTQETHSMASAVKVSKSSSVKGIKLKRAVRLIFPKISSMQYRYPVLKKCPVLLPFVWIWRFFDVLLFKRDKLNRRINELNSTNEEAVTEYQKAINYVGLDFNYKD